jgi:allantoicase
LGESGHILGFDIDTSHFDGNEAPEASDQACFVEKHESSPTPDDGRVSNNLIVMLTGF